MEGLYAGILAAATAITLTAVATQYVRASQLDSSREYAMARDTAGVADDSSRLEPARGRHTGTIWLGISHGAQNWGGEIGGRFKYVGISVSEVDIENRAGCRTAPDYEYRAIPTSDYSLERFGGYYNGYTLYGFYDPLDWMSVYGSVGWFFRHYVVLAHSRATGRYYATSDDTYENSVAAFGVGVHLQPIPGLTVGLGMTTLNGLSAHFGYSF